MPTERWKNERGLTMVEVLVAVVILSVCLIPLLEAITAGSRTVHHSRRVLTALNLAKGKIEELKASGWEGLDGVVCGRRRFDPPYAEYEYEIAIMEDRNFPRRVKVCTVTVYYRVGKMEKQIGITGVVTR